MLISRSCIRRFASADNLSFCILVAATVVIIANSCLMERGRPAHARVVDLAGGMAALASGLIVHRRRRSLAGEITLHSRLRDELHRLNEALEANVKERTALLESTNSFLETIVHESPLAVVVLDLHWCIRVWSPAAENLFGWTAEEVVGNQAPFIPPGGQKEWEEFLTGKVLEGEKTFFEVRRLRKDGTTIDLSAWTSPLHGESGVVFAHLLIYADDRDRKRAEEALRNSDERFARFMDNLPGVAFMKDSGGRYIYANRMTREFYSLSGVDGPDLKTDREMWPPDVAERFIENDREVLASMRAVQVVEPAPARDGTEAYFLVNKFPVESCGERILCGVGVDITELTKAERALADLQSRQEAILENIPDLVWLKDREGRCVLANSAFERTLGIPRCDIEGKTDLELWPEELAVRFREDDRLVAESRTRCRFEERLAAKTGDPLWFETLKSPLCREDGEVIGTIGISRDITGRKKIEERLRNYQEQLSVLAAELSLAEERERRRISSELHDRIGQSLAIAKMKLNALASLCPEGETAALAGEVRDVLDESIGEVRSLTFQVSPPLLYEIGFEPALEWLCEWMKDNYSLRIDLHRSGPPVRLGDEERGALFRVVRELLINCGKHAGTDRAAVSFSNFSGTLELTVEDRGTGFDVSTMSSAPATGFGLFNIRQRIRYMGGECHIDSAPGRGTTITVRVPLQN